MIFFDLQFLSHLLLIDSPIFPLPGFVYYFFWLFLSKSFPSAVTILASSLAMTSSVFLAIRLLILGELCVLCWSTHVINARLFWSMVVNLVLGGGAKKKKEKVIKRV